MKKIHYGLCLPVFLILSFAVSSFCLFLHQISEFSIEHHTFHPSLGSLIPASLSIFMLLVALWAIYSIIISRLFSFNYKEALSKDFLTYLPLLALSLAPLTLVHYLDSKDISMRAKILFVAVAFSIIYLKLVQILHWNKEQPAPWKTLVQKISSLSLNKKLGFLFLAALIVFNASSLLMISEGNNFTGDEPHYLLMTHSLLYDGDLELANNYERQDYTKYNPPPVLIRPHVVPGAKKGSQYSFHSPGTSFFLLPFYALGSLFGRKVLIFLIRLGLSIIGALFGLQVFLYAKQEWHSEKLAFGLWFLTSFTTPVLFYSIHVYPEIFIALFSFTIFRLLRFSVPLTKTKLLLCGFLLSAFIWFHALKYVFMLVPFFLYCLWIILKKQRNLIHLVLFLIFPVLFTSLYFIFQYSLYGSLSISTVSWKGSLGTGESISYLKSLFLDIPLRFRIETLAGYFFDQRDGLLFYAPIYFFAFLGMVEMIRRRSRDFLLLLFLAAPYVLVSAFLTQRTGYAPQARPLVAAIWGMGILLGYFIIYNHKKIFSYLFSFSAFLSLLFAYLLLKNPIYLYQETTQGATERGGGLFYILSNLHFHLPSFLPSYLKVEEWKWLPNFIWIGLLLLFIAAYLVTRKHDFSLKFPVYVLLTSAGIAVFFFLIVLYPRVVLLNPVKAPFPSGEKITFYSLSRVARMEEPGKFLLPEDNRSYTFYFTSRHKIEKFQFEFGSLAGDYSCNLTFFDKNFFDRKTSKEIKNLPYPSPPFYWLKNVYLYRITIDLKNESAISTAQNPYLLSFWPSN
jgi:hypothetical protein